MPKALIITYYWPPSGGSAVLRWLKFAKYLKEYGWEPVIYTPKNPEPQEFDTSLLQDIPDNLEVIKKKIREPYRIYKWLTGRSKDERLGVALISEKYKGGLLSKFSLWIRSNLFIPDPRIFWVKPSIRLLAKYLCKHSVDVVITTGPPHSMHLIGMGLKKKTGVKWVADFRDPWTNIDFYQELMLTRWADKCHRKLEQEVLQTTDRIIAVSPSMSNEFKAMGAKNVFTITNGYDGEIASPPIKEDPHHFTLLHLGSLPRSRNPVILWEVLSDLAGEDPSFAKKLRLELAGKVDIVVQQSIQDSGLQNYVIHFNYIPHSGIMEAMAHAQVLLLVINNTSNAKGILTNKFFEYLSARRPILAIGPEEGDAATILDTTGAGKIFGFEDRINLKKHLLQLFALYSQGKLQVNSSDFEKYSRRNLAAQLAEILNTLIG
jgi:hypothetical protein